MGSQSADQTLLMTVVGKAVHSNSNGRILGLQLATRDLRNSTLTGLRYGFDIHLIHIYGIKR